MLFNEVVLNSFFSWNILIEPLRKVKFEYLKNKIGVLNFVKVNML
jgi:hypothetical protein